MARTITDIQNDILAQKNAQAALAVLSSDSQVALWRLMIYIVAVCIWTLEKLFDIFKTEVDDTIGTLKPHSARWYANKAKGFMYGYNLIAESDVYDLTGLTETQIRLARIVNFAAVVEQPRGIRIKVAKLGAGGDLEALTAPELLAFVEYMERVKDAGVKLLITSGVADSLRLILKIYFNPLVLNALGARLDGITATPVQDAIDRYLKNLPFNGVFVTEYLTDQLQQVDGVVIPHIMDANARYGVLPYTSFAVKYTPDSGYLRRYNPIDLTIEFIAQSVI